MTIFKKLITSTLLLLLMVPLVTVAAGDPRSFYASLFEVMPHQETLPVVVNVPMPRSMINMGTTNQLLVYEVLTATYIDSELNYSYKSQPLIFQMYQGVSTDGVTGDNRNLLDGNPQTTFDLLVAGESTQANSSFLIQADSGLTLSEVKIDYALNSPLPKEVAIYAQNDMGYEYLVFRSTSFDVDSLVFPPRISRNWRLAFVYEAPVRLSEIKLGPEIMTTVLDGVRFLAQPNQFYEVYLDPETVPFVPLRSSGNLNVQESAVYYPQFGTPRPNPLSAPLDTDKDGVSDKVDNCPNLANPDQASTRGDGIGDVCDDFDYDGRINSLDICQLIPNPSQRDTDGDGIGDECDEGESRLTEQYPWLPWLGIGIALIVILSLFVVVARHPLPKPIERTDDLA